MSVRKTNKPTKDGRLWIFETRYNTLTRKNVRYTSKNLIDYYYEYQKDKVKGTTMNSYRKRCVYLEPLYNVKLNAFNTQKYLLWRKEINKLNIVDTSKNDIQKYLKIVLNFATRWYGFNFNEVYSKIEPFKDPNAAPKEEMLFFTYDEFKKFLSVEKELKFRVAFEILYFCGTRRGELLALTWKNVDFNNHEIIIKQNLVKDFINKKKYLITTPKTKSSNRIIPIPRRLEDDLKQLKEEAKKNYGFKESWFVLGFDEPLPISSLRNRKCKNCDLAGVKQIRLHDFRHSCASLLISKGANITLVAKYLGHTKIDETLNTYSHFFKSDLDSIVLKLDDLE